MLSSIRQYFVPFSAIALLALALVAMGWSQTATAALYKCTDAGGKTEYKDKPCKSGEQKLRLDTKKDPNSVGLHPSWFKKTRIGNSRLTCTEINCKCGVLELRITKDPKRRLFNSLHYFPDHWEKYDDAFRDYINLSSKIGADKSTLERYACLIAFRKKELREIYAETSGQIINKYETLQAEFIERTCPVDFQLQRNHSDETCLANGTAGRSIMRRKVESAKRSYDKLMSYVEVLEKPKP